MADYKGSKDKLPAAAAASLPVSKDKEVSPPLRATRDVVKQIQPPQRPLLPAAAVLVDVKTTPASPPVAVLQADDDNKNKETPPPPVAADRILLKVVCLWALVHAFAFAVVILVADGAPCTKLTWLLPPCVALTDAADAEVSVLLQGELWCSAVAALAALLHMRLRQLTARTRTTRRMLRGRWAAAVDALLAWVALAATAGIHYMQVAFDRIYLAADPGERYFFVNVVLVSGCLAVDVVLAGFLLCCCRFPRRLGLVGEQQGDDGEV